MKKLLLIVFVMITTGFSTSVGRNSERGEFETSVRNLKHEADSLNILVKKYNEKTD